MEICSFRFLTILLLFLLSCFSFTSTEANAASNENITIKWDVISWTPDGYVAVVSMYNYQRYRSIKAPGWSLGWTWAKKEIIWDMLGSQTTDQGDCSRFKGNIPHSCHKSPTVIDLMHGTPYNQQIANCCKGGVLESMGLSAFQLDVGGAGTTNSTVKVPLNFTLKAPAQRYICGQAKIVNATKYITEDGRRYWQAMMTWSVTCIYSQRKAFDFDESGRMISTDFHG